MFCNWFPTKVYCFHRCLLTQFWLFALNISVCTNTEHQGNRYPAARNSASPPRNLYAAAQYARNRYDSPGWSDMHRFYWQVRGYQVPLPLTLFRSNSKFNQNLECSGLKCALPITTKFCTGHDSYTVVTGARFHYNQLSIFQTRALQILGEFRIQSQYH